MAVRRKRSDDDPVDFLAADHRRLRKLFRSRDIEGACAALKVHAQLEAEIFYPAAREALDPALLDEAEVEHGAAGALIAELERLEPADPYRAATFAVLARYAAQHFKDEEKRLFPRVRAAGPDLRALATELRSRAAALSAAEDLPGQVEPSPEAEGDYEPAVDEALARLLRR